MKKLITICLIACMYSCKQEVKQDTKPEKTEIENEIKFPNLDKSPMDVAAFPKDYKDANKIVKVRYSRPQLKGRSIDSLAPQGKVWRTGANEATEITFYQDMMLGKTKINKGTYSIATIPGEKTWTFIINKDLNTWGTYFYNIDNDVARFNATVNKTDTQIEAFSMTFEATENGTNLHLGWDTTTIVIPFTK